MHGVHGAPRYKRLRDISIKLHSNTPTDMVGKLNYSKWDNLELSDDSDVEVHPNVDKKSFIRWKQQDIHEKREIQKQQLEALKAESKINDLLKPMLDKVSFMHY